MRTEPITAPNTFPAQISIILDTPDEFKAVYSMMAYGPVMRAVRSMGRTNGALYGGFMGYGPAYNTRAFGEALLRYGIDLPDTAEPGDTPPAPGMYRITMDMTPRELLVLSNLTGRISGPDTGPRAVTDSIYNAVREPLMELDTRFYAIDVLPQVHGFAFPAQWPVLPAPFDH